MSANTAASMFGGAGGRGSRVSVASLEGLRNVLRNETERDSAPVAAAAKPAAPPASAAPAVPTDDKQTLRSLNDRLSGYLARVSQLKQENDDLEKEIDAILAKRKAPEGRKWDEVEKPLDDLKQLIKDITLENANLLLGIDNNKLANDDLKGKLDNEKKVRKVLEKDLEEQKKTIEDTQLNHIQTQKEIDLVKEELARLEKEHKEEVDVLCEKIKDSEVKVEVKSQNSNLAEIVNSIRLHYDNVAKKNLKDTEEWYQSKFDNIKVELAQNNENLNSGKSQLKELLKQKQYLEVKIQGGNSKIYNLEEALRIAKVENGQHLGPLNQAILNLEAELRKVRAEVERLVENNQNLLFVKMKLEEEMNNYQQLIHGIMPDHDSLEFSLEDGLHNGQPKPDAPVALSTKKKNTTENEKGSSSENEDEKPKKEGEVAEA